MDSSDGEDLEELRRAALLTLKTKKAPVVVVEPEPEPPVSVETGYDDANNEDATRAGGDAGEEEEEEEYIPCNSISHLVDIGIDEPYSPSRPALMSTESDSQPYLPSSSGSASANVTASEDKLDLGDEEELRLVALHSRKSSSRIETASSNRDDTKSESKPEEAASAEDGDDEETQEFDLIYGDLNINNVLNEEDDTQEEDKDAKRNKGISAVRPVSRPSPRDLKPLHKDRKPYCRPSKSPPRMLHGQHRNQEGRKGDMALRLGRRVTDSTKHPADSTGSSTGGHMSGDGKSPPSARDGKCQHPPVATQPAPGPLKHLPWPAASGAAGVPGAIPAPPPPGSVPNWLPTPPFFSPPMFPFQHMPANPVLVSHLRQQAQAAAAAADLHRGSSPHRERDRRYASSRSSRDGYASSRRRSPDSSHTSSRDCYASNRRHSPARGANYPRSDDRYRSSCHGSRYRDDYFDGHRSRYSSHEGRRSRHRSPVSSDDDRYVGYQSGDGQTAPSPPPPPSHSPDSRHSQSSRKRRHKHRHVCSRHRHRSDDASSPASDRTASTQRSRSVSPLPVRRRWASSLSLSPRHSPAPSTSTSPLRSRSTSRLRSASPDRLCQSHGPGGTVQRTLSQVHEDGGQPRRIMSVAVPVQATATSRSDRLVGRVSQSLETATRTRQVNLQPVASPSEQFDDDDNDDKLELEESEDVGDPVRIILPSSHSVDSANSDEDGDDDDGDDTVPTGAIYTAPLAMSPPHPNSQHGKRRVRCGRSFSGARRRHR